MKEGFEKYCKNGLCDSRSRPKRYEMDEHIHQDPKKMCWYSGCQCEGERPITPEGKPVEYLSYSEAVNRLERFKRDENGR